MKIGFFFQGITFIAEFSGSKILLLTFSLGGKWGFEVTNLLLATVNFEPYIQTTASAKASGIRISNENKSQANNVFSNNLISSF